MRVLLDTHVALALLELGSVTLKPELQRALTNADTELLVSVASLWEIALKVRAGKLSIGMELSELPIACASLGMNVIAIEARDVLWLTVPEPATRDPFDRLLIAQAQCEDVALVTLDAALLGQPVARANYLDR